MPPENSTFGGKLHHQPPFWIDTYGAFFHIRIRCTENNPVPLTTPLLAEALLESVRYYQERHLWHVTLFLLMPDHLHALISFPPEKVMSKVVGNWKHFHAAKHAVIWQENYFDHRLRDVHEAEYKYQYILNNPVVKGLCKEQAQWPWKLE